MLLEENGTTDFGGTLLKYYAAEGVLQGHHIHILGMHQGWGRELPGQGVEGSTSKKDAESKAADDKMKIAWRYERLGEFGASGARGGWSLVVYIFDRFMYKLNMKIMEANDVGYL